jgi:hypothetical protein
VIERIAREKENKKEKHSYPQKEEHQETFKERMLRDPLIFQDEKMRNFQGKL